MRAGWVLAHKCLTVHMKELERGFDAFSLQLRAGKPLSQAQADSTKAFWGIFDTFLHQHHHSEEHICIPYMKARVDIREKVSAEHTELIGLLDECRVLLTSFLEAHEPQDALATLEELSAKFKSLTDLSISHFEEEEQELVIPLRKAFTPLEVKENITEKIFKGVPLSAHAPFFRTLSKTDRLEIYAAEKMPFFVPWLINFAVYRHTKKVYMPYMDAIIEAESYKASEGSKNQQ